MKQQVVVAAIAGAGMSTLLRRAALRTGARDDEAFGELPGDDVIAHPMVEWNRALTVHAPAEAIWPWFVQAGHGRAGWYTPRWVDRLFEPALFGVRTDEPHRDDVLHDHLQHLAVGDVVADGPDFGAYFRIVDLQRNRWIVYQSIRHPWRPHPVDPTDDASLERLEQRLREDGVYLDFTWTFVIHPDGPASSRLQVRTRANYAPRWLAPAIPLAGLFDATYGVAMLAAVATRAETTWRTGATG